MIELLLPYPPSINHYWLRRGKRVFLSPGAQIFRAQVQLVLQVKRCPIFTEWLQAEIDLFPPDKRKRDSDNPLKALFDALQHGRLYQDDYQIVRYTVTRYPPRPPQGATQLRIQPTALPIPFTSEAFVEHAHFTTLSAGGR